MIRITVYAGIGLNDAASTYEPTTTTRVVPELDVSEELRKLGLEWRQADYFPGRQTIITLDPVEDMPDALTVMMKVREAAASLEGTSLL